MQFGTFNNTDTCHTLRHFHSTKQCADILYYNTYVVLQLIWCLDNYLLINV